MSIDGLLPELQQISDAWLASKATGEKRFSVGYFSPQYLRNFPLAVVRAAGDAGRLRQPLDHRHPGRARRRSHALRPGGAARGDGLPLHRAHELGPRIRATAGSTSAWRRSRASTDIPLAPAWHRVGNFVFRHGEHFYNFEGLRRYKAKFEPHWEPKYLIARGGIALPRVLMDVSVLIAGGVKELFAA